MSRASEFFDRLVSSPVEIIEQMIQEQQQETDYLEFKGGSRLNPKDVRRYWSQALSGFGNTEGGILIWGVEARKTNSQDDTHVQIEAACNPDYVPNPTDLAETLRRLLLDAVLDPIPGVVIKPVSVGEKGGFVICFVPQGNHPPYRAALDESRNYFQRVRDSFVILSHSLLRSLFYPRIEPSLFAEAVIGPNQCEQIGKRALAGWITLGNKGQRTARDIVIHVDAAEGWELTENDVILTSVYAPNRKTFRAGELHPGQTLNICKCRWVGDGQRVEKGGGIYSIVMPQFTILFHLEVFCADHPMQTIQMRFDSLEASGKPISKTAYPLSE